MKFTYRLVALSTVLASAYGGSVMLAACSSSPSNGDAGADGSADTGTKKDSGVKDTGVVDDSGDDGSTPIPTVDPLCAVPDASPSNGSCAPADDAGTCNPVTNEGCDFADGGYSCDFSQTSFSCYNAPPNTAAICATCDLSTPTGPACLPGSTCVPVDQSGASKCAKYCCTDADCTGGHCDLVTLSDFISPAGVCVK